MRMNYRFEKKDTFPLHDFQVASGEHGIHCLLCSNINDVKDMLP